ncbi:hypothetical protein [Gillisia limnaea]|uniref:Glycosyltransferase involved in cell wall biosynthesis n=1 Tax=Gillisia limnaea (strain DSM 15749 / LMG 21470 / R-8282) TaxID=865937 RepID=H2BT63_GILLR|nr:hypothetical protein [Gillisia limnaea]EHQ02621.1 hypothetical protein Gilli_1983 [Gillisia limnaea DSM 15749]
MKILFICGCLEPGKDGVGDYTRRLAGELIKNGHEINMLSLNDHFLLKDNYLEQVQALIPVIRIRLGKNRVQTLGLVKRKIEELDPEWLSLQYVPFSFHLNGLPLKLAHKLSRLAKGRCWHIMFHELWVGIDKEAKFKHLALGTLQKFIINSMVKTLKPKIIHTQSNVYLQRLDEMNFTNTGILSLFGNIPVTNNGEVKKRNSSSISQEYEMVIFGTIHPGAPLEDFVQDVVNFSKRMNINPILTLIGICGNEQERLIKICLNAGLPLRVLGEQSPEKISQTLAQSSLGISTTPLGQIEKSGTVASMLEHSLPVICVARSWTPKIKTKVETPAGIFQYKTSQFETFFLVKKKNKQSTSLALVAIKFVSSLYSVN